MSEELKVPEAQEISIDTIINVKNAIRITDEVSYASAATIVRVIKEKLKIITDEKKSITDPLKWAREKIDEHYKKPIELLSAAEKELKSAMLVYKELQKLKQEAQAKLEKENPTEEGHDGKVTVTSIEKKVDGVSTKEIWTFEIIDPYQIPREFLKVDEVKIGLKVRAGVREIQGVNIFSKKVMNIKT
jgi:hypothetical protein